MNAMLKLFSIRGGIHPEGRKQRTASLPIEKAPLPPMLYLPMRQHVGVPSEPVVTAGDHVKAGQLVGICSKDISAMMHAPTSGEVVDIGPHVAPHPSGLPGLTLSIRPDGKEECVPLLPPLDPFLSEAESIAERIAAAGIVGMGGAVFPAAEKLELRSIYDLHTLVINGAECEPYLTTDDRLMRERAEAIIDGARIIRHTLGVKTIIIAIEANKPEALAAMAAAARDFLNLEIRPVAVRYPMGSEKHLVQALTGLETPAGQLPVALGVLVHNVATAHAVHEVVRFGKPLTSRIITVSGGAIRHPANLEVLIGTPIRHLVEICGG
ncbi:MAG TPA: electron transport complex subunit RsxC, partial [Rhodobacteraceae bacterium]|nr:electron transport complex subunit RsxC [Paracoccaceae bacterium]